MAANNLARLLAQQVRGEEISQQELIIRMRCPDWRISASQLCLTICGMIPILEQQNHVKQRKRVKRHPRDD